MPQQASRLGAVESIFSKEVSFARGLRGKVST
jgi:hypothetical protein